MTIRQELVEEFPQEPDYLAAIGSTINNLGVLLGRQGKTREALAMFQHALTFKAQAYQTAPEKILWGRWLCIGLRNVARTQAGFSQQEEALRSYEQAAAIRQQLAFDNPAVPSLKSDLYKAWLDLGNYQRELGKKTAADRSFRAARRVLENIPRNTPAELFELALVYAELAKPAEESADLPADEAAELHDTPTWRCRSCKGQWMRAIKMPRPLKQTTRWPRCVIGKTFSSWKNSFGRGNWRQAMPTT